MNMITTFRWATPFVITLALTLIATSAANAQSTWTFAGNDNATSISEEALCTIALDVGSSEKKEDKDDAKKAPSNEKPSKDSYLSKSATKLADLPQGMTSFGAAVVDQSIYVMGGKEGRAHHYAKSYQNPNVYKLSFAKAGESRKWESAAKTLGLQGLGVVSHNGKVYRIGGLEARNKEGEDSDLHSLSAVLCFDPKQNKFTEVASLPKGRSSLDAIVVEDSIWVIGGWQMAGEGDSVWATDALQLDLSNPNAKWNAIDAPFTTRALTAAYLDGKIYAIGGIKQTGGPTGEVHVLDLETKKWSKGPAIPAKGGMKAFGSDSLVVNGDLLVSTYDGAIHKLSADKKSWEKVHTMDGGRFFHQMMPISKNEFAILGGAHMSEGQLYNIEVFKVNK